MQAAPSRREETPKKGIGDSKAIAQTQDAAAPHELQEFFCTCEHQILKSS